MVQDEWRSGAKNEVLIGLLFKTCYSVEKMKLWWGKSTRENFGHEWSFPPSPK